MFSNGGVVSVASVDVPLHVVMEYCLVGALYVRMLQIRVFSYHFGTVYAWRITIGCFY